MPKTTQRIEELISNLSPEEKAKIAVEDRLRTEPLLPPPDYRRMLASMKPDDGVRFNAFIKRTETLRDNLIILNMLVGDLKERLYQRDRILFYLRALDELTEEMSGARFNQAAADTLLVNNPNLKPNKPIEMRVTLATVTLGVWGKRRTPFHEKAGVKPLETIENVLLIYGLVIRSKAAIVKAIWRYIDEESRAMELDFMAGLAREIVDEVAKYDKSVKQIARESKEQIEQWDKDGLNHEDRMVRILEEEPQPLGMCLFPVENRWALEWEEVNEDPETASLIKEDPLGWLTRLHGGPGGNLLEKYRDLSRI